MSGENMIYTTGTIAGSGSTLTGTGTNFTAAGTLIRNGCTVIVLTSPVQVFQITGVTSATQLAVSPAVNPAIPAGTRYSILLSDSLSVDGLALDIAETFKMYQAYMGGFADVMQSTGTVTITINGKVVTVPGMQSVARKDASGAVPVSEGGTGAADAEGARENLELGSAAVLNAGTNPGEVMTVGAYGFGRGGAALNNLSSQNSFGAYWDELYTIGGTLPTRTNGEVAINGMSIQYSPSIYLRTGETLALLAIQYTTGNVVVAASLAGTVQKTNTLWGTANTTVDGNGFIKQASPIARLTDNPALMQSTFLNGFSLAGVAAVNDEAAGVEAVRVSTGVYEVRGAAGLHNDGWTIEIPQDANGNRLCFVETDVADDGAITVRVFKRRFDIDTAMIVAGDPMDIPEGRWIDLRLEMPADSIYNRKMKDSEQAATKSAQGGEEDKEVE